MLRMYLLSLAASALLAAQLFALPAGFHQKTIAANLDAVSSALLPDGRIMVVEKYGKVTLIKNGASSTFLDWSANTHGSFEKGMMCVIADPHFDVNGYIYVQYTDRRVGTNGQDRVSRFKVKGDAADPASEKLMISLGDAGPNWHHGGGLAISPDDKLFIAVGCRGPGSDNFPGPENASDKNHVEGKILRINLPEGDIPSDNPFYAQNTGDGRAVYYMGFRNPFTMSFRSNTLWWCDVHNDAAQDEVNEGQAPGTDYGYFDRDLGNDRANAQKPAWTASSANAPGRAMIGILWYSGANFPKEYQDKVYFGNVTGGSLWYYDANHSGQAKVFGSFPRPIDVKMDSAGAMYLTTRDQTEGDQRYCCGQVIKVWYGDTEPTTAVRANKAKHADMDQRMTWSIRPGNFLRVDLRKAGEQTVELRSLAGKSLASWRLTEGVSTLLLPAYHGAQLLVWKQAGAHAVVKIVIP